MKPPKRCSLHFNEEPLTSIGYIYVRAVRTDALHCVMQTLPCIVYYHVSELMVYFSSPYYGRKEGNVLFNDALNTFYLRLYGVRHMVKDHSDSERGSQLPPHGLLFPISSKGSFYMHHPTDRISHTTAFVTPVVEHWLEGESVRTDPLHCVVPVCPSSTSPSHRS